NSHLFECPPWSSTESWTSSHDSRVVRRWHVSSRMPAAYSFQLRAISRTSTTRRYTTQPCVRFLPEKSSPHAWPASGSDGVAAGSRVSPARLGGHVHRLSPE